jgi:laminin alpha 3/5
VGGLPDDQRKKSVGNLGEGAVGFNGCLRDITFNMLPIGQPTREFFVQNCSSVAESGTYFGQKGGHVVIFDKFRVGQNLDIAVDIKPRSQEGVLLSVHGNGSDFVVLQLSEGSVIFTTDNGAGPITIQYVPQTQNSLCDGQWHSIRAIKNKHILTLTVDGINVEPQNGKSEISAADTNDPLYIGGITDLQIRGVVANGDFSGCIRNLRVNNVLQYLATGTPKGDVKLGACPAT